MNMHICNIWCLFLLSSLGFTSTDETHLRIGAFNVQTFGASKMSQADVVEVLSKIVQRYDILLIQEIREISETSIYELRDEANSDGNYTYEVSLSERLGNTGSSYQEQYAYLYRTNSSFDLQLVDTYQYNDEPGDEFIREPYCVLFTANHIGVSRFALIGVHIQPDEAYTEIDELSVVRENVSAYWNIEDIIIMGDLNADCTYLSQEERDSIDLWTDPTYTILIDDDADTTVSSTDCAYDMIISSGDDMASSLVSGSAQVFRFDLEYEIDSDLTERVSDHYPVEMQLYNLAESEITVAMEDDNEEDNEGGSGHMTGSLLLLVVATMYALL